VPGECIATARFAAYLSGHLDDAEVAATERHLDACAACRAVLVGAARAQRSRSGPTAAEDGAVPGRLGRFEVRRVLGAGGMGVVYEAYDAELARRVAIKVMRPELPASALARTRIEALALARLSHPNVVQLYEIGVHEGRTYLVTELVEGEGLRAWMASRRSEGEVLGVFAQAGAGLAAAHAVGLVHRDFKPDNVIVGADGRVRVLDFGLARDELRADPAAMSVSWATTSGAAEPPTETGAVMGTPAYMAPEQRLGAPADPRSDQYSFFSSLHPSRRPTARKQGQMREIAGVISPII
jgi:eukaryotic-like serine/threonine-protein kinase